MHPILCWAWIPGESTMMSMGDVLKYFILPERKQKINTETVILRNTVGVVLSCLLLSITLCVLGIWFLPSPRAPSYPFTVGRIKEETGSLNI